MPSKVIPDNAVEQMLRRGMSRKEIVEELAAKHQIIVTPAAITVWKKRRGLDVGPYAQLPWVLAEPHRNAYPAKMLRLKFRRDRGGKLTENEEARLDAWLARVTEDGLVVHYDPDTDEGFFYIKARPGIDQDFIRNPEVA